ncbi:MAG: AI-2E family transporter [Bacteroidota bacterium]
MKTVVPLLRTALYLLIPILFIYGIIEAKTFLFPLVLALLFAYLLYPVVHFLEKKGLPKALSILLSILAAIIIIGGIMLLFYSQLNKMFADFEKIKAQALSNIETLQYSLEDLFGMEDDGMKNILLERVMLFFSTEGSGLGRVFTATTGTLVKLFLMPVYVFLFLYFRTKLAYFILHVVKESQKAVAMNILRDIATVAERYMGGMTLVVLILCVINSTGLLLIGIDYAILLGIISAFVNFIPYFGTLMGGSIPFLFVLLTTDDPITNGVKVLILFILVQFTENNILTPNIVGGNVNVNPLFVIVGLVAGATIWGIAGMVVIVPVLAMARIAFINTERLKPFGYLIGPSRPDRPPLIKRLLTFLRKKINGQ